jgi:hypothetical protein
MGGLKEAVVSEKADDGSTTASEERSEAPDPRRRGLSRWSQFNR